MKTQQKIPNGVNPESDRTKKFASVDGDADRLIYFYLDDKGEFHMLDGDKIATLIASYIRFSLFESSDLTLIREELNIIDIDLTMGVVQTAYANGASTSYLQVKWVDPTQSNT